MARLPARARVALLAVAWHPACSEMMGATSRVAATTMITEDQSETVDFLASPGTHVGATVERINTHSAIVFLVEDRAYKLKRAVAFDYLDFSTAGRRQAMCEAEVRLNRRTAPTLYRRVLPITRDQDGSLALGGTGTPVDWVVEMTRFPQEALFDRLAASRRLDLALMPPLASAIAAFHAVAERRSDHGGRSGMAWVVDGNVEGFAEYGAGILDPAACRQLTERTRAMLEAQGGLLEERRLAGFVRQCHGDLHLRNIVLLDGRPTLFDGVEFNDEIACTDVLYDVAFLLMDLWRRGLPRHANVAWNRYVGDTGDLGGLPLLPFFLSCRAAVRAKTSATAACLERDPRRRGPLEDQAREYLAMADGLLRPPRPCLVAVGGFSGTGKSTVALGLAPVVGAVPGAVVIRSDEIRKQLCGVPPLERLGPEGYAAEISARVYAIAAERASTIVQAGHSAIVDAVFARSGDRQAFEHVAGDLSAPFFGIWLEAPESMLVARIGQRHHDPSDADAEVVRQQHRQPVGEMTWHRLDASSSSEVVTDQAKRLLAGAGRS